MNIRAKAAKIIDDVIFNNLSLDLKNFSTKEKKDLSLLNEICFGSIRWFYQLDFLIKLLVTKPLKKNEHLVYSTIYVGLYQLLFLRIPEYAAISETVNAVKDLHKSWAVPLVNAVLRNFLRNRDKLVLQIEGNLVAKYSHPKWLLQKLQIAWSANWREILQANNAHPPMHLRVNLQKISSADYVKLLAANNIAAHLYPKINSAVTLENSVDVYDLPKFAEGFVSVQDLASELAANLLELKPGLDLLDACAAPGGKFCHILETEPNLKSAVAIDISAKRLSLIRENLRRLNLDAVVLHKPILKDIDILDYCQESKLHNLPKFDRILLDAPCSATGVIRRHPDIKLLRQETDIKQLAAKQLEILNALWQLLKVEGILLYATCSILPEENTEVIEKFLQKNFDAEQKLIDINSENTVKYGLQILPGQNSMDGFYYAKLVKHAK